MSKFQIGDIVQVKSYEELLSEYGIDEDGDIWVGCEYFTEEMRRFCNQYFRIEDTEEGTYFLVNEGKESSSSTSVSCYNFSPGMLRTKEIIPPISYSFDDMFLGES